MQKNKIILGIIVIVVLAGIVYLASSGQEDTELGEQGEVQEVLSLSAVVLNVDAENNSLMVKPNKEEREVKVVLSETTKLIRLEFLSDSEGGVFTPTQTEIEISDFKTGDKVFIKAKENIAGKSEFNKIDFIHILP